MNIIYPNPKDDKPTKTIIPHKGIILLKEPLYYWGHAKLYDLRGRPFNQYDTLPPNTFLCFDTTNSFMNSLVSIMSITPFGLTISYELT